MTNLEEKLKTYISQLEKDLETIERKFKEIEDKIPLKEEYFSSFTKDYSLIDKTDQIAFRFIKFQDTLGKTLKVYFLLKGEPVENLTIIDIVNLASRVGFEIDENLWFEIRSLRNSITHEYPEDYSDVVESLNRIYQLIPIFKNIVERLKR